MIKREDIHTTLEQNHRQHIMDINEKKLRAWIEQADKRLEHLERNQMAIINGDFWGANTAPKEPLIKDKKVRKAVRAWAEANNVDLIRIVGVRTLQSEHQGIEIEFNSDLFVGWVRALKTIAELCGVDDD